jgi:NAD(P)-dependent dehydrogenase (short-subunit alcohol dehydrogenase family)
LAILEGKVAIVTGGGRGIGRAHALELARDGAAVLVNDLGGEFSGDGDPNSGPARDVAEAIIAAGGRAAVDTSDISDWDGAGAVVEAALQAFGRLDIVVNNAGVTRFGTIDAVSRRDWERTIAVNLTGTAALCHWAAAHWREKGPQPGRSIVNTTSGVGLFPGPGNPMYTAAKAGVAALTVACAAELAWLGVRVNGVAPVARSRISEFVAAELMKSDFMKPVEEGFDRMDPGNVAAVVAFLASPLCRFTGRIFGVAGDDVTVCDGWTVSRHLDNGEQRWTPEALQAALADVPVQQQVTEQALKGVDLKLAPPQEVLEALAAAEKA